MLVTATHGRMKRLLQRRSHSATKLESTAFEAANLLAWLKPHLVLRHHVHPHLNRDFFVVSRNFVKVEPKMRVQLAELASLAAELITALDNERL